MTTKPGSIPWLLMIVVEFKNFSIGNLEQSSRLTAGGFFIFCNLPLLVDFDIIRDTGNGVAAMKIPVDKLKPGMLVHVSHYDNAYGGVIEFRNMRIHAYIPSNEGVVFECGEGMGARPIHNTWKTICDRHGYPMDPNKRYVAFCSINRSYYSAVLDKSAISTMLVQMHGD